MRTHQGQMFRIALIGVFLVAIFVPLPATMTSLLNPQYRESAGAVFSPFTVRSPRQFAALTDEYLEDHFILRHELNLWVDWVRIGIPGLIARNSVIVGQDGWLFLSRRRGLEEFRASEPLDADQLETIRVTMAEREAWLAAFGIRYLYLAAPEKWDVYPEKMPGNITVWGAQRRLDQVLEYLRHKGGFPLLDVRPALRQLKQEGHQVYFRTDTHWTDIGSWAAAGEGAKALGRWFPAIGPEPLENFVPRASVLVDGNLVRMAGLERRLPEPIRSLKPAIDGEFDVASMPNAQTWSRIYTRRSGVPTGVTAVVFTDSFGPWIAPFLSRYFDRSVFVWRSEGSSFDPAIVLRERPDVVIQELGQLTFDEKCSINEPGIAGFKLPVSGTRFPLLLPAGKRLRGFDLEAATGSQPRAQVEVRHDGATLGHWRLGRGRQRIRCDIPLDGDDHVALEFVSRLPASVSSAAGRGPVVVAESGGEPSGYCHVEIDGVIQSRALGFNLYHLSADGDVRRVEMFHTDNDPDEAARLAQALRNREGDGYLLIVSRGNAFRHIDAALPALRELGLHPGPAGRPEQRLIALIDNASGAVIREASGPGRRILRHGSGRKRAAFTVSNIRIE